MNEVTHSMRAFALQLIAHEKKTNKALSTEAPVVFGVCEKLRPHLSTLMGNGGYRALLARALVLASAEAPWLSSVRIEKDGLLNGLDHAALTAITKESAAEDAALLTQLLGLLVAFIGETLTRRLMLEVWPKLPRTTLNFGKGNKK